MTIDAQRQLKVLEAVHRDEHITQRNLSAQLGIALGLANIYLKRLVTEGLIVRVNGHSNRLRHVITAKGIAEKARLTREMMAQSLEVYRDVRRQLSEAMLSCSVDVRDRIAMFGIGEAAELIYLSLKEQGHEPVAIFAAEDGGTFLGMEVLGLDRCADVAFDRMLVATLDAPDALVRRLTDAGISFDRIVTVKPLATGQEA